jgi:hypothetical protein
MRRISAVIFSAVFLTAVACSNGTSPLDTVENLYTAYLEADVDAFLGYFTEDGRVSYRLAPSVVELGVDLPYAAVSDPRTREAFESFVAVGPQMSWDCEEQSAAEIYCSVNYVDDFYGPAGFEFEFRDTITFNADGQIESLVSVLPEYQSLLDYHTAYFNWLESNHPDSFKAADIEFTYSLMRPSAYPALVGHVEQFVAQSDTFPIEG